MKKNMSSTDSYIRYGVAVLIILLYALKAISGTTAIVLGVLALIFIITGYINFCPIYHFLGISTRKKKK